MKNISLTYINTSLPNTIDSDTLYNKVDGNRVGNTTRMIDAIIQALFNDCSVRIVEHNRHSALRVRDIILYRLEYEHNIKRVLYNPTTIVIKLDNSK